jgi:large subunit ribosomal protein L23
LTKQPFLCWKKGFPNKMLEKEQLIIKPIITEKATTARMGAVYVFEVLKVATKIDVKNAVEQLFKVKVKSVNTVSVRGKLKKVGKTSGTTRSWKKAYVALMPGHKIELIEGMM